MLKNLVFILLELYQKYIRAMLPCSCRFVPTCSDYTREAISKYGMFQGVLKSIARLLSCHPLSGKSGYNPLK